MNFRCVFKHKWKYFEEDIEFVRVGGLSNLLTMIKFGKDRFTIPSEVRLCERCYKKQFKRAADWVNYNNLTKEQLRDKKLTKMGI